MNRNGASPLLSPLIKNHLSHLTTQLHATWFSNCRHGLPEVLFRTLLNFILTPPITSLKPKTRFSLKYSCQLYFIPKCMPNRFIESLVASNCRCWSRIFTFCIWEFFFTRWPIHTADGATQLETRIPRISTYPIISNTWICFKSDSDPESVSSEHRSAHFIPLFHPHAINLAGKRKFLHWLSIAVPPPPSNLSFSIHLYSPLPRHKFSCYAQSILPQSNNKLYS